MKAYEKKVFTLTRIALLYNVEKNNIKIGQLQVAPNLYINDRASNAWHRFT